MADTSQTEAPQVLIAEADPDVARLIAHIAGRAGATPVVVASLREVPDTPVGAAVIDGQWQGAEELIRRTKAQGAGAVLISGYPADPLRAHASQFLRKPFTIAALSAALRVVLGSR